MLLGQRTGRKRCCKQFIIDYVAAECAGFHGRSQIARRFDASFRNPGGKAPGIRVRVSCTRSCVLMREPAFEDMHAHM